VNNFEVQPVVERAGIGVAAMRLQQAQMVRNEVLRQLQLLDQLAHLLVAAA
jgi:hypothetical protein